jgi:hypothetical protein
MKERGHMGNIDIEIIEARLTKLEEAVFGMDYETAKRVVDTYMEALKNNPGVEASPWVLKAEKILGV